MHLRDEIRRERCRLQASRWCRSGCSLPPARRSGTAKSSSAGKSVSSWVPPRWGVRGKGLSCGHDERIHHLCYGRKYALFISEALFGDCGEDSLRGQKKSTDSIEPMLILRENILTHQTLSKCRTSEWMILENALVALPAM